MVHKNNFIVKNALELSKLGLGNKDSLHISCAIDAKVDFFLTVDKGIIKKRALIDKIKIFTPIEYFKFMEDSDEK